MVLDTPHHARASQSDLMALTRFRHWERTVAHELPSIIADGEIKILFQPIYRLGDGVPVVRGFEALSRFPVAPRIPVGLWFRTARDLGLLHDLERAAIGAAIRSLERVPEQAFLCVNASVDSVPDVLEIIPSSLDDRLMIDLPYSSLSHPRGGKMFHALRGGGARVAVDDVPLENLHVLLPTLLELRPDCVKVDVLTGLVGSPMARFDLAEASASCQGAGIDLIAERVERMADLPVLNAVGVEWTQGYCLSRPVEL